MRVICVDDEKLLMEDTLSMCRALPQIGEAVGFTRADEALEWLEHNPADLALLDIDMPGMNGLELAAAIKARQPETAIIFLTGYAQYAVDAFSLRAKGFAFQFHPVDCLRLGLRETVRCTVADPFAAIGFGFRRAVLLIFGYISRIPFLHGSVQRILRFFADPALIRGPAVSFIIGFPRILHQFRRFVVGGAVDRQPFLFAVSVIASIAQYFLNGDFPFQTALIPLGLGVNPAFLVVGPLPAGGFCPDDVQAFPAEERKI